jgi:hypothetical protein
MYWIQNHSGVVYFDHFQSVILYGLVFWGTPTNLKRVFLLLRRIIRIMLGLEPSCSCRSWFKKLDVLLVTCLYIYSSVFFVVDNQDLFQANSSARCIKTRQSDQLHKPFVALSCIQKGVRYSSVRIFNAWPVSLVKLKTDKSRFKNALKRFLEFFSNNSDVKS